MADDRAKVVDLSMRIGPDPVQQDPPHLAAAETHFRHLGGGSMRLYQKGDHVPAEHAELDSLVAVERDGVWWPVGPGEPE